MIDPKRNFLEADPRPEVHFHDIVWIGRIGLPKPVSVYLKLHLGRQPLRNLAGRVQNHCLVNVVLRDPPSFCRPCRSGRRKPSGRSSRRTSRHTSGRTRRCCCGRSRGHSCRHSGRCASGHARRCPSRCPSGCATGLWLAPKLAHHVALNGLLLRPLRLLLEQFHPKLLGGLIADDLFFAFVRNAFHRITKRFAKRTGFGWLKEARRGSHKNRVKGSILARVQALHETLSLRVQNLALLLKIAHRPREEILARSLLLHPRHAHSRLIRLGGRLGSGLRGAGLIQAALWSHFHALPHSAADSIPFPAHGRSHWGTLYCTAVFVSGRRRSSAARCPHE